MKTELSCDLVMPPVKENEDNIFKRYPHSSSQLPTYGIKLSINEKNGKDNVAPIWICSMEYYATLQKKSIQSFATAWMKLTDIMLSEMN